MIYGTKGTWYAADRDCITGGSVGNGGWGTPLHLLKVTLQKISLNPVSDDCIGGVFLTF